VRRALAQPSEDGTVAGLEALAFGVAVFVVGTLLVLSGWRVVDAKFATSAAAREAVRAAVLAPHAGGVEGMASAAATAAVQAVVPHGYDATELRLVADLPLSQRRCAPVRFSASVPVELPVLPWAGGIASLDVSSTSEGLIDPYRSGLAVGDGAGCGA
jgi:hypothetical protein